MSIDPKPKVDPVVVTNPPAKPGINWQAVLMAALLAALGVLTGRETKPTPTPVNPPVVVVDQNPPPVVQPSPNEKPDVPKPTPAPTPTTGFTIVDSKGTPILDEVGSSRLIICKPIAKTGSVLWIVDPPIEQSPGPDNSLILTTPATYTVLTIREIAAVNGQLSVQTASLRCGHSPQPTPTVDPVVTPPVVVTPPDPVVPPGSKKFTFYVVEEKGAIRSATTGSIISNLAIQTSLRNKGHTFVPTTNVEDKDGAGTYAKKEATALPALVLYDNQAKKFVKSVPLPTDLGLSLMTSMGG